MPDPVRNRFCVRIHPAFPRSQSGRYRFFSRHLSGCENRSSTGVSSVMANVIREITDSDKPGSHSETVLFFPADSKFPCCFPPATDSFFIAISGFHPYGRWKFATCPAACTPASVRPDPCTYTGKPAMRSNTFSSLPCIVFSVLPCFCQPSYRVPSYCMIIL